MVKWTGGLKIEDGAWRLQLELRVGEKIAQVALSNAVLTTKLGLSVEDFMKKKKAGKKDPVKKKELTEVSYCICIHFLFLLLIVLGSKVKSSCIVPKMIFTLSAQLMSSYMHPKFSACSALCSDTKHATRRRDQGDTLLAPRRRRRCPGDRKARVTPSPRQSCSL